MTLEIEKKEDVTPEMVRSAALELGLDILDDRTDIIAERLRDLFDLAAHFKMRTRAISSRQTLLTRDGQARNRRDDHVRNALWLRPHYC